MCSWLQIKQCTSVDYCSSFNLLAPLHTMLLLHYNVTQLTTDKLQMYNRKAHYCYTLVIQLQCHKHMNYLKMIMNQQKLITMNQLLFFLSIEG